MSKSMISDEAIKEMVSNKMRDYVYHPVVYIQGARDMRELMLKEIVAPLVLDLKMLRKHGFENRDNGNAELITNVDNSLKQHAERVGE